MQEEKGYKAEQQKVVGHGCNLTAELRERSDGDANNYIRNHKCAERAGTQEINKILSSAIGSVVLPSLYIAS